MSSKKNHKELAQVISSISEEKTALELLKNLLTPKELDEIALRVQIFKHLNNGTPQRDIAKKLGVSIGTISRGSREWQYGPSGIQQAFKNLAW